MKIIIYLFCCVVLGITSLSALSVTLKENHDVQAEFLMLSDFFNELPQERDQEILEAPACGEVKHYPHAWVRRLAQNFGLYWNPTHYKGITLARQKITSKRFHVQSAIKEYLTQNYADKFSENTEVIIDMMGVNQKISGETNPKLINFSWIDNQRFVVTFDAAEGETKIRGRLSMAVYVPVLNKAIRPGDIIQKEDIEYSAFPQDRVTAQVIQNEQDLIGKTVRRSMIQSGNVLNVQDIVNPVIVKRGDLVTMRVESPGIVITARGKAQGNAAAGQVVQVLNLESKRLIEGVVKDSQIVIVPVATRQ